VNDVTMVVGGLSGTEDASSTLKKKEDGLKNKKE
jgi:hypothetical protein